MTLPDDYARCQGTLDDDLPGFHPHPQCSRCQRFTSQHQYQIAPPPFNADGACPERIAPPIAAELGEAS